MADEPVMPADVAGLVKRLKCQMGNPSAWDCYDECASELIREAATALEAQAAELAMWREVKHSSPRLEIIEAELTAERAAHAETRKALGMMLKEHDILSGNFGDVMDPKHKRPDRWPTAAEAARRALEGGE